MQLCFVIERHFFVSSELTLRDVSAVRTKEMTLGTHILFVNLFLCSPFVPRYLSKYGSEREEVAEKWNNMVSCAALV